MIMDFTFPAQLHFCGMHKTFCLYYNTFSDTQLRGAKRNTNVEQKTHTNTVLFCAVCRTSSCM